MLNNIRLNIVQLIVVSLLLVVGLAVPALAAEDDVSRGVCSGAAKLEVSSNPVPGDCQKTAAVDEKKVNDIIKLILNIFTTIVGIVAVIFIIVGGFKYITSGGDSGRVTSAKNTIIYALIGLVIVALAQFLVRFILSKTTETVTSPPTSSVMMLRNNVE